jgi:hypothetical protein
MPNDGERRINSIASLRQPLQNGSLGGYFSFCLSLNADTSPMPLR